MGRMLLSFLISVLLLFPLSAGQLRTAAEISGFQRLTTYEEMIDYLQQLDKKSRIIQLQWIGQSVEGRKIPGLFFTRDKEFGIKRQRKPVVLIFCQQHGDEPSGKEAALILARKLFREDKKLLKNFDLILVPQVNPDGSEMAQRRNANKMDLNRNHAILSEPEVKAIHQLFLEWMPEVTLDVHEFNAIRKNWISNGYIKGADEMMGVPTNLNISPDIRDFAYNTVLLETGEKIVADGFRFSNYIVGTPFPGSRIRFSTTAINDGRQSMAIYNTLSFLIEGKRYGAVDNLIQRRVAGQLSALRAFLEVISTHATEILKLVHKERKRLLEDPPGSYEVYVSQDYFPDPEQPRFTYPVFDLYSWEYTEKELPNFAPVVKTKRSVKEPLAYLLPGDNERLQTLLQRHRFQVYRLTDPIELTVEAYYIKHITDVVEEDKPAKFVDTEQMSLKREFPQGTLVLFPVQPARLLIPLLLEPFSTYAIIFENSGRKYKFEDYLQEENIYPIYRLMDNVELPIEEIRLE